MSVSVALVLLVQILPYAVLAWNPLDEYCPRVPGPCVFSCPQGHEKRASGLPPIINGCGGEGGIDVTPMFPGFLEMCNHHDECYGTCGFSKAYCDERFGQEMMSYCQSWCTSSIDYFRECQKWASRFTIGVNVCGCSFYLDGQRRACTCTRSRST